jgi:hypothetical protein
MRAASRWRQIERRCIQHSNTSHKGWMGALHTHTHTHTISSLGWTTTTSLLSGPAAAAAALWVLDIFVHIHSLVAKIPSFCLCLQLHALPPCPRRAPSSFYLAVSLYVYICNATVVLGTALLRCCCCCFHYCIDLHGAACVGEREREGETASLCWFAPSFAARPHDRPSMHARI